ncbi:MAG: CPBP family intramembrane metalloprotease, partial [Brachymonas sp.]|nr:CPBP family intramembrane metalloprotease [Brachymonas sp.]
APPDLEPLSRSQVLIAMGVTAILLLVAAKVWRYLAPVTTIPFTWDVIQMTMGVGIGIAITLISAVVYQLWPKYRESADLYLQLILSPLLWPDLIWLGLLPGLSEELLFRGVMLPAFGLNVVGLIASSICFGVLHMSGRSQWPYVVWATVVGLLLGYSAMVTGNLLVPVVAHVVTNLISSLSWKLKNSGPQTMQG